MTLSALGGDFRSRRTTERDFAYQYSVMNDETLNGLRNAIGYARAAAGDTAGARRAWLGIRWASPYPERGYPNPLEQLPGDQHG